METAVFLTSNEVNIKSSSYVQNLLDVIFLVAPLSIIKNPGHSKPLSES